MRAMTLFLLALLSAPLAAQQMSASQRHLYEAIAAELRCPASVNLTVLESQAPIAFELKARIAERLLEGASKETVMAELEQRYGPQIRYRPAVEANTWLLWFGPLGLFCLLVVGVLIGARRSNQTE
ncbi:cytochrome c-type biogenesis protein [Ferrimonas balearica]|uniref:cytochrome c-type biogenesis protein n=1 Tax=Ferrimonas balearica TaxID=44012 RepID=UPI001F407DDD|nr:cytochrome c-type biogenesis protein [Ferrimonas balearica]MBY6016338.1 cytochrome c-type biogenesis protein CcmH [Halomonas denitrificans]MBY6095392.1 cytochrome c-type biogenesis protein CcmH [Ferrimonas balearica]